MTCRRVHCRAADSILGGHVCHRLERGCDPGDCHPGVGAGRKQPRARRRGKPELASGHASHMQSVDLRPYSRRQPGTHRAGKITGGNPGPQARFRCGCSRRSLQYQARAQREASACSSAGGGGAADGRAPHCCHSAREAQQQGGCAGVGASPCPCLGGCARGAGVGGGQLRPSAAIGSSCVVDTSYWKGTVPLSSTHS